MFLKPFRVKTQTTVKGSDRKKLRSEIEQQYPAMKSGALAELIPNKGDMTEVKVESHSGEHYLVYCCQKVPVFFQSFKKLYPTVYTLWKFPDILPVFTTYPPVFHKLLKGADLMLPGVEVKGEHHPKMFGNLQKGDLCVVRLKGNKAPVLLGETLLSGDDMYMSAMKGKGVRTIHIFRDTLWEMGDKSLPPQIPCDDSGDDDDDDGDDDDDDVNGNKEDGEGEKADDDDDVPQQVVGVSQSVEQLSVGGAKTADGTANNCEDQGAEVEGEGGEEDGGAIGGDNAETSSPEAMDERLRQCFKWAIKGRVGKNDLPLLTSNLLKMYMQPFCPPGSHIDVKKSSFKKFSKFLQQMQKEGFIKVKEVSKGVDAITEIDKSHLDLRGLEVPEVTAAAAAAEVGEAETAEVKFEPPVIKEVLCVNAAVVPLLSGQGYRKGSVLTLQELRQVVTEYVKSNNLQNADSKEQVTLDPVLAHLVLSKNEGDLGHLTWNTLFTRICDKMQPGCLIQQTGGEPVLRKGNMPPISFKVVKRGGNKKVTFVDYLESYGVDVRQCAQLVQKRIACSASCVNSEQHGLGLSLQVQGDQTNFLKKLFLETYQIPKKYVQGADNIKPPKRR